MREYEVAAMKFEESQKYQQKLAEFKKEHEKKYLENVRRVKEREENVLKLFKLKNKLKINFFFFFFFFFFLKSCKFRNWRKRNMKIDKRCSMKWKN